MDVKISHLSLFAFGIAAMGITSYGGSHLFFYFNNTKILGLFLVLPYNLALVFTPTGLGISLFGIYSKRSSDRKIFVANFVTAILNTALVMSFLLGWRNS